MSQSTETQNKAIVLEAFDTLFNKRDYVAAARFWSPNYVQHSAHIGPGRDGLFNLIKSMPPAFKHEPQQVVADGELVIVHSRFSGFGQAKNWIVADFVRVVDGLLVEHWDVVEDEASETESKSGRPMFGDRFPISSRLKIDLGAREWHNSVRGDEGPEIDYSLSVSATGSSVPPDLPALERARSILLGRLMPRSG